MRLWHYKLIPFLPDSQLISQWRELNSIFKNQPKHILINYVYKYPKGDLYHYCLILLNEMNTRGIKFNATKMLNYFKNFLDSNDDFKIMALVFNNKPFENHHDNRYLWQCFANLQEKYDRGQKDFSNELYEKLECFIQKEGIIATYKVGKEFKL